MITPLRQIKDYKNIANLKCKKELFFYQYKSYFYECTKRVR